MAGKLESSKSDLRHAEERLVAAVRARKELEAKLEEIGGARPVGHGMFAVGNFRRVRYTAPSFFRCVMVCHCAYTLERQRVAQVPTDADYERWGEEIKEAIRRVVEKDESEDVIDVLEGAAMVARAALAGRDA